MKKQVMMMAVGFSLIIVGSSVGAGTPWVDYSFGDWAVDTGLPIDATYVDTNGAGITRIEADDLAGMNNLQTLGLGGNAITSIEPGAFSGMHKLYHLEMDPNPPLVALNLSGAQFRDLTFFSIRSSSVDTVDLTNAELSQLAFNGITNGGGGLNKGIASSGIIEIHFAGANLSGVEQLNYLYPALDLQVLNLANVIFADSIINDNYDEVVQLIVSLERETLNVLTIDMDVYNSHKSYFDDWDSVLFNELTVVPEPCSLLLISIGGLVLRKRK